MTDLITRIETEPPSRSLEDDVLLAFGWERRWQRYDTDHPNPSWVWFTPNGDRFLDQEIEIPAHLNQQRPSPLTNLQDALDLVGSEYSWSVSFDREEPHGKPCRGIVIKHPFIQAECIFHGRADNPAAALTIACLKAKESE